MRWASHEKPALFFSVCLGASGPPLVFIVPPIRRYLGDVDPEKIPMTYPGEFTTIRWCFWVRSCAREGRRGEGRNGGGLWAKGFGALRVTLADESVV